MQWWDCTELCYKLGHRLRELAPRGQREPGGGIHAAYVPSFSPSLYFSVWCISAAIMHTHCCLPAKRRRSGSTFPTQ